MEFIKEDTYVCLSCGCMFKREELGKRAPDIKYAIEVKDNIHCISCGKLGLGYMAKDLKILFR